MAKNLLTFGVIILVLLLLSLPLFAQTFVTRNGTELMFNGAPYRFIGANVYQAANSDNYHCNWDGSPFDEYLETAFQTLREEAGANAVRFWAFQSFAAPGGTNYTQFDRVIETARRYNLKLIFVLENQWSDCSGGAQGNGGSYKYNTWYQSSYLQPYDGYALSYRDYVGALVAYYRDEPTILMWQLMNEAESESTAGEEDPASLYNFAGDMSAYIKSLDPNHLVNLGTMGTGQPGTAGDAYETLHALSTIDILEAHDYHDAQEPFPGGPLVANLSFKLFLQDADWTWEDAGSIRPTIGDWTTYEFTIPSDITFPLQRIGIWMSSNKSEWQGEIYIDEITIGPNHVYSFEEGTVAPWVNDGNGISSVVNSANYAHDGTHSLQINFSGENASGRVNLEDPTGIAAGDVMTLYLYTPGSAPVYSQNSIAHAFYVAERLNKPIFIGEAGIKANCSGCSSPSERAALFDAKISASFDNGGSGYLLWQYVNGGSGDEYKFSSNDPVMDVLLNHSPDALQSPSISNVFAEVLDDTAVVSWTTDQAATSQVEFGLNTIYGLRTAEDTNRVTSHSVILTELGWNQNYHYRVRSKGDSGIAGSSGDFVLVTPSALEPTVIITAFADHGDNNTSRIINQLAADQMPGVHLHAGDWHYQSSESDAQNWWDNTYQPLRNSGAQILMALGNHESSPSFEFNMAMVGMTNRWYSYTRDGIFYLVLDSNLVSDDTQLQFIENELQAAQTSNWQIVVLHHTPFSSGEDHGGSMRVRSTWSPIFEQYGVDLVVAGHEHSYERTANVCSDETLSPNCPVYLTVGSGGQGLDSFVGSPPSWSLARRSEHQVTRLEATANEMYLHTLRYDGALIDIAKVIKVESTVSPLYGDVTGNGEVTAYDAYVVLQAYVGLITLTQEQEEMANVSGEGGVTPLDASLILRYIVGLLAQFPVGGGAAAPYQTSRVYTLSVGEVYAKPNERIAVPISVDDASGILSGAFLLTYDSTYLNPIGVSTTSLTTQSLTAYEAKDGVINVSFANTRELRGKGAVLFIEFECRKVSKTPLKLTLSDAGLNEGTNVRKVDGYIKFIPEMTALLPNYPNPFNPDTWIPYQLNEPAKVVIRVYNVSGQLVRTLDTGPRQTGFYADKMNAAYWNGRNESGERVASGVYFYQLEAGEFSAVRKLTITK